MKHANPKVMKEWNLQQIRKALQKHGAMTKSLLAEYTGLSVVTVNALIRELEERGEVEEDAVLSEGYGRPAARYAYHMDYSCLLTICLYEEAQEHVAHLLVQNLEGAVKAEEKTVMNPVTCEAFFPLIGKYLEQYPNTKVIALGIPAPIPEGALQDSDYGELVGRDLRKEIENRFHLPTVLENDINAAVLGFQKREPLAYGELTAGIYFPKGYAPGAGFCLEGRTLKGKNGFAGEVAYLPMEVDWEQDRSPELLESLIMIFVSILNPHRLVIYGDFFDEKELEQVLDRCSHRIRRGILPQTVRSTRFREDFLRGVYEAARQCFDEEMEV